MMRVLFDTSIVLNVLLNRQPWVKDSSALWRANDDEKIVGYGTVSQMSQQLQDPDISSA